MYAAAARATRALPDIPCDAEGPVFREPWEAQAFAMTLALHERLMASVMAAHIATEPRPGYRKRWRWLTNAWH